MASTRSCLLREVVLWGGFNNSRLWATVVFEEQFDPVVQKDSNRAVIIWAIVNDRLTRRLVARETNPSLLMVSIVQRCFLTT